MADWTVTDCENWIKSYDNVKIEEVWKKVILERFSKYKIKGKDLVGVKKLEDVGVLDVGMASSILFEVILSMKDNAVNIDEVKMDDQETIRKLQEQDIKNKYPEPSNGTNNDYAQHVKQEIVSNTSDGGFYLGFQGKNNEYKFNQEKIWYRHNTVKQVKEYYINMEKGGDISKLNFIAGKLKFNNDNATLEQIGITSTIQLTTSFRVDGGAYYDKDVIARKRVPDWKKYPQLKATLKPDCIMGDDDKNSLRVEMPCGHVFAPLTLFQYIKMLKENLHALNIICPVKECNKLWDTDLACAGADLTFEEKLSLKQIMENRQLKDNDLIKDCPHCKSIVSRPNDLAMLRVRCSKCKGPDFCWRCAQKWQGGGFIVCGNDNCSTKLINQQLNPVNCGWAECNKLPPNTIPKLRACPRCLTMVIHEKNCKHVKCWGCHQKFCFVCLSLCDHSNNSEKWTCGGAFEQCEQGLAAIQVLK